jgi:glycolate oxidase iron-sulfur subunit
MQTNFTAEQLANADVAHSESILRRCVHCGFCTATCPTFVLLGDELDSPRGRIYLIKDMLENDRPATKEVVKHLDRCLGCLSCMSTCPSGVNYMHLIDHAKQHIERTYDRPFVDRWLRRVLAILLPRPGLFRLALIGAVLAKPFISLFPKPLQPLLALAPTSLPAPSPADRPGIRPAQGEQKRRVAVLPGCAQQVLAPGLNEATQRVLTRHGCEVVVPKRACCGALTHHMGKAGAAYADAKRMIDAWYAETAAGGGAGLDAIIINASGCGTTVKDYGHIFGKDPAYADKAAVVAALAKDITELILDVGLGETRSLPQLKVAYHSACSMQHGQQLKTEPLRLLKAVGFTVRTVPESHLCCGSAGTYNMLQPDIAAQLRDRKVANIDKVQPDVIAAGNLGCMTQIGTGTATPIVHTVELIDWATGGPVPDKLSARVGSEYGGLAA